MVNTQGKKNKDAEKGGPMTLKANCLIIFLQSVLLTIHENLHKAIPFFSHWFPLCPLFHVYQCALSEHIRHTIHTLLVL